jgi:hypothetical protein
MVGLGWRLTQDASRITEKDIAEARREMWGNFLPDMKRTI